MEVVIVPVSSGGLVAGIATALKSTKTDVRIIGVQPEGSRAVFQSFKEGAITEVPEPNTICDALIAARPGAIPFEHVKAYVDDIVLVSDDQAKDAVRALAGSAKLTVEPGGAVAVAAVLSGAVDVARQNAVAIVSGGNIDLRQLAEILSCVS